jgi:hypothetical protein
MPGRSGISSPAVDTIAANGVHGAFLIGPRHPFAARAAEWRPSLSAFEIDLNCDGRLIDRGAKRNRAWSNPASI